MLTSSVLLAALAATGLAQVPDGYRTVYITSMVNSSFVVTPKSTTTGSGIVVQVKANKPEQQWYIKDGNTSIQLAGTKLCLDAGAKTAWKDMANIYVKDCADTEVGQKWEVKADGRIAVSGSSPQECIDLQYMRATNNNPVGLYACAGLNNAGAADKGINWPLVNITAST